MSLIELQQAIEALPAEQQASLAAWLAERDRRQWDFEVEQDFSSGGAGMSLLDHVRAQVDLGESKPMAERRERR
jgi:hypothetical protein